MSQKNILNFIDVFAGAGGLSCGLEMNSMRCLLGIDSNKHAMDTFAKNHKYAKTYCGDVSKLTKAKIEKLVDNQKIHAVVGGPPCQGFSTVGPGNPDDARNSLFLHFVRIVKTTSPEFVVIENVTGLLAKKNEKTLKSIFKRFETMGYHLDVRVMSSQNYGVPEIRRRTIIIGTKLNVSIEFPKATHDTILAKTYINPVSVGDVISNLADKKGDIHNHDIESALVKSKTDEKRLLKIPEGCGIRYKKDELAYLPPRLRLGIDWDKLREKRFRQTKYFKLDRKKPSPTIMTHRHSYYHPVEPRYLTQREAAKLQSFPNDFVFEGSQTAIFRQIGNAVPPLMAHALGVEVRRIFNRNKKVVKKSKNVLDHSFKKKAFTYSEPTFV